MADFVAKISKTAVIIWLKTVQQALLPVAEVDALPDKKPVSARPNNKPVKHVQLLRWPDGVTADNIRQICQEISLTAKP